MMIHQESVASIGPILRAPENDGWLTRFRSSEADAVGEWVRAQAEPLLQLAHRYLRDEVASREVVRDALLRALLADSRDEVNALS